MAVDWLVAASAVVWALGYYLFIEFGFGSVYFLLSLLLLLFLSLGSSSPRSPNTPSAYAAFNEGCRPIMGTTTGEEIDRQIRHQTNTTPASPAPFLPSSSAPLIFQRQSKYANAACPCGSGRRFKACCSTVAGKDKAEKEKREREYKQWKQEWT